ncbi:Zn(II)2Cys6 transcription factor [Aspergillus homomorphus CBS 101889]|uniref:Zn(2)-C6 fungal-type domain-containing protein n=1 Tax=Aspergillus homomorphus (strain CBS 101889) TaxID=1450537 RepID=A0A395HUS8_ASPHC|nr:hypothetical protein BO97DRAFT_347747 [Aspergillus homomorphus CBS 101889]RAL11173.1 hypothetical protein BO97DRAFT_347747 [Aspergillus homomorphus CBS 101889]
MFLSWSLAASPPPEPPQPPKPRVRSRTGCNTCRRRRVKCDEAHPTCLRCRRSKYPCSYEVRLQWEDEMRTAGKCHGRTGVQSKVDSLGRKRSADSDLNQWTRARRKGQDDTCHADNNEKVVSISSPLTSRSSQQTIVASEQALESTYQRRYHQWNRVKSLFLSRALPTLPWSIGMPDVDHLCLSFYESVMCPVAVTVDDEDTNPLRSTVMRMAFRSELTYYAVLMASSQYMRSFDSRYTILEMQVRQRVLGGLRQALARESWDTEDISASCDSSWVRHFTCFQLLVKRAAQGNLCKSILHRFFVSYFSAHLIFAKSMFSVEDILPVVEPPVYLDTKSPLICTGSSHKSSWTSTTALLGVMESTTLHNIDIWNGLSNHLLLLINDILSIKDDVLALKQSQNFNTPTMINAARTSIETKIVGLKAGLGSVTQLLPKPLGGHHNASEIAHSYRLLENTGEAYRLAACLLLSEASKPSFLGFTSITIKELDSAQEEDYISKIFTLVDKIVSTLDFLPISWPLWPLFIASCCSDQDSQAQAKALALFRNAREKAPYENTVRAQTLVELLWQRRTLNLNGASRMRIGRFEWEVVMEFLGWQTSFA